jgi:hypothetical protein
MNEFIDNTFIPCHTIIDQKNKTKQTYKKLKKKKKKKKKKKQKKKQPIIRNYKE